MHRNRDAPSGSSILARIVEGSAGKSTIRLRQLRHFLAAADHGSFRKAAIALDINESSVSRQIRDLEDELGASLFIRHSGGVRLTVAGQEFLRSARHALRQIDIGVTKVAAVGRADQGLLKVGIFSSLASGFLFNLLRRFGTRHPTVGWLRNGASLVRTGLRGAACWPSLGRQSRTRMA
jgi:DNA-binding transcriptional LysR family regulator